MDLRERTADGVRHPWEQARAHFFCDVVETLQTSKPCVVLDVGAGDGWLAEELLPSLPPGSKVVCWDINYSEEDLQTSTRSDRVSRVRDLDDQHYDLVLLLDVLEHVEDDEALITASIIPRLNQGAILIVSVPVHPGLFTQHDTALAHYRRYKVREIRAALGRHFDITQDGSLFTSLLFPRAVQRALEAMGLQRSSRGVGSWKGGKVATSLLRRTLEFDIAANELAQRAHLTFPGLSYWAVLSFTSVVAK